MKKTKTLIIIGLVAVAAAIVWMSVYKNSEVTGRGALEEIKTLPEVQEFVAELEKNGKTASFNVEDQDGYWSVQVYEIVARGGESHTATFNWYRVDKSTGIISKELE